MPPKKATAAGAKKIRRKEKKNVAVGQAYIKSTFNNTIVSITDPSGAVISNSTSSPGINPISIKWLAISLSSNSTIVALV